MTPALAAVYMIGSLILALAHLWLGLWIGRAKVGRRIRRRAHDSQLVLLTHELIQRQLVGLSTAHDQAREVLTICEQRPVESPRWLRPMMAEMVNSMHGLHDNLETAVAQADAARPRMRLRDFTNNCVARSQLLSASEVVGLVKPSTQAAAEPESRDSHRHPYRAKQFVGYFRGDQHPTPAEFRQVQCNDLSSTGISFYSDQPPDSDRLVITVGTADEPNYFESAVRWHRLALVDGEFRHLVGCEFERRLPPGFYAWDALIGLTEFAAGSCTVASSLG